MSPDNSDIEWVDTYDEAIDLIEEKLDGEISRDNFVPLRGAMASITEGYEVPEKEKEQSDDSDEYGFASIERAIDTPEYIPSINEVLEWGSEKGLDNDMTLVAPYRGITEDDLHVRDAIRNVPNNLDMWNVSIEKKEDTRPVILVYDEDEILNINKYRAELPVSEEKRSDLIDYAVVIDCEPT